MENQTPISKPENGGPTEDVVGVDVPRLVRRLFEDSTVYLYSVKLLRESRVNPNEQDRYEEFHVAGDIRDVWAAISLELLDEAVEVESVNRCVPILSVIIPTNVKVMATPLRDSVETGGEA